MTDNRRDFDNEAAQWDKNPVRVKLAKDICEAIIKQVPFNLKRSVCCSDNSIIVLLLVDIYALLIWTPMKACFTRITGASFTSALKGQGYVAP